jgi:SprB repeat/Secretion system C-terminal sorting domain/Putative Ig domain
MKMKTSTKRYFGFMALVFLALLTLQTQKAEATHFRYGHLTWQKVSGNTARFTLVDAFRRNGYAGTAPDGFPAVGDVITETIGATQFFYGDGNSTGILQYKVISIDVADNWLIAQALEPGSIVKTTLDHTYSGPTQPGGDPWLAEINAGNRTSSEQNNPNGAYRVLTYVELTSGNTSPSSSLPAIILLPQKALAQFTVPGADPDASSFLTWRLATSSEAGGVGGFNQPAGLTIDPTNGLVSWNTLGTVLGGLYSCQVIIEDRDALGNLKTQVAVDFLIEIVDCSVLNNTPAFVSPSPTCGHVFNTTELVPFSFTVTAEDADAGEDVDLNTGGGPSGSTFTPNLPNAGNPVSTTFNWTPALGQAGSYVVTFSATDECGAQVLCSYTINVAPAVTCNLTLNISNTKTTCFGTCDGTLTANHTGGTAPITYLWSNGQTTKTAVGLCKGSYTVTITDAQGCSLTKSCAVNSPSRIIVRSVCVNVKCKGSCTGSITANPTGGSGTGYTYLWSNGQTTKTISGLCKGTYTVTVTDSKGCTGTLVKTVTEPATVLGVTVAKTDVTVCAPNCNGAATANQTGGVSPYTYLWSTSATTKQITGICEGTYTVTVTDKNGCTAVGSTTISSNCCTGDFTTYTQGGWGNTGAPGQYMAANFESCFDTVTIGDACGYTIKLTTVQAVRDFLPQGSTPDALTQNYVDPGSANITVLAGQVLGVAFALGFDDCDANFGGSPSDLGSQIYVKPGSPFYGWSIQAIYNEASKVLAGCASIYSASQVNEACTDINENYDEGANNGLFVCPGAVRLSGTQTEGVTQVYPNPFKDIITISYDGEEAFNLIVTDLSGRVVGIYNGGVSKMEIGKSFEPGVYLVTLTSENGYQSVSRIVKN